jgi:signal transduction histidine kinase
MVEPFPEQYARALEAYLIEGGEAELRHGYELGRLALRDGLGVLGLTNLHSEVVGTLLRRDAQDPVATATAAGRFLAEALSPYEMTHQGFREANSALQALNETLEQRVIERTAQAEAAKAAATAAEQRWRILAEASRQLEISLDQYSRLRSFARFVVPTLADWCVIDIVAEDGGPERAEVAHRDSSKEVLLRELRQRDPVDDAPDHPVSEVLRTGKPRLISEITDGMLKQIARDERHLQILRAIGYRSAMIVPLTARGRTLAAITLASSQDTHRFDPAQLDLATELANRAGLAVDNARLYTDLRLADQAKFNFLATMSHELRTPLNAIMGYTDLLLAGVVASVPPEAHDSLRRVQASAEHLLELIEQILTFSRAETGSDVLRVEPTDAVEIARNASHLIEPATIDKGLELRVICPPDLKMRTDQSKIRQILVNLLSNAVKFTERGSIELEVTTESPGWVVFHVRDTGPGIAADDLDKIFDAFWQAEQTITRRFGGTGLGLTISRRLARALGGDLTATSVLGEGSEFTLRLPLKAETTP